MNLLQDLEQRIGVEFKDSNLLIQALTHKSYLNEHRLEKNSHNERLEFLGDALLEVVITVHLFSAFPDLPEGTLTQIRSAVVNQDALFKVAENLDLDNFVRLSRGEQKDMRSRPQILANAVEAIIGALYLDQGQEMVRNFVAKFFFPLIAQIERVEDTKDHKSVLQELSQDRVGFTPRYKVHSQSGPDHDKKFEIGVYAGEQLLATGKGASKAQAEQNAAKKALHKIRQ